MKERDANQQGSTGFSRAFSSNMPPRFQNVNRQNSGTFSSNSSSSGPVRNTVMQTVQCKNLHFCTRLFKLFLHILISYTVSHNICSWKFTGKSVSSSFTMTRHIRADSESLSDKDRDWNVEDSHKDRDIERLISYFFNHTFLSYFVTELVYKYYPCRYATKELTRELREYNCSNDETRKYENKSCSEYDAKRKYYDEKEEYNIDSSNKDLERENYSSKM